MITFYYQPHKKSPLQAWFAWLCSIALAILAARYVLYFIAYVVMKCYDFFIRQQAG
ncbi:MAG TPA: hypothetical protein VMI35_10280 [Puia sp.]|nr:hypothetical protein [Puia sp.]